MNTKIEIKKIGGEKFLNEKDLEDFSKAEKKIYGLMCDHEWHSATEIINVSGQREGLRRLRKLRENGLIIETKRESESRDFLYKMSSSS
jgi:hypothetical protein